MKISQEGLKLIKHFEGCSLTAYIDPVGVPTIGYGSTGAHVTPRMRITQRQADELLIKDLSRFERGVDYRVKVQPTQGEFDAFVSFSFNLGLTAFQGSTMLKLFNAGKKQEAAKEFCKWNKAAGKVFVGLVRRRAAEEHLYTHGVFKLI